MEKVERKGESEQFLTRAAEGRLGWLRGPESKLGEQLIRNSQDFHLLLRIGATVSHNQTRISNTCIECP